MTQKDDTFAGIWHCCYWYPSNTHEGEDISEYYVKVHQMGSKLIIESLPNKIGAYMFVNLTLDGDLATGSWQEDTAPEGEFKGAVYSGALQLLLNEAKDRFEGKWVGVGQEEGKRYIYTGRWELARAGSKTSADIEHAELTRQA